MPWPSIGAMEVQLLDGPMEVHAAQSAPPACGAASPSSSSNQVVPVMEQLRGLSEQDQMVLCQLCGGKVGLAKAILRGKQAGTFRCRVCHSKAEIMRKRCGGSPPSIFANMSEKDIQDFYGKTKADTPSIQREIARIHRAFKRNEKVWALGGEFRPLGYWTNLGYDEERIKANSDPGDVRECRIAGAVYRVPVMSHGERASEGTEQVDVDMATQAPSKRLRLQKGQLGRCCSRSRGI
jgi:hypothetical protein